jgi:hypothetical protein
MVGAGLAAFNEITALALPLAIVAVLARGHLTMELPWRTLVRRRACSRRGSAPSVSRPSSSPSG